MAAGEVLKVSFEGPYSWPGTPDAPSIFEVEIGRKPGIYLWTVRLAEGYLVYYVGATGRSFRRRMFEHYKEHASGMYHVYDPVRFARGEKFLLWPGIYDSGKRKTILECIWAYQQISAAIAEMTSIYRFLLAPLDCAPRIRQRIEAAIARHLYEAPEMIGAFQDAGIRYTPRRSDEPPIECEVSASVAVLGLPARLSV